MEDQAVTTAMIAAVAAWAGVGVNACIAVIALKDQIKLPYRISTTQRMILQTLAQYSERTMDAYEIYILTLHPESYQDYAQFKRGYKPAPMLLPGGTFRMNLASLERKGAITAIVLPTQSRNSELVHYRITDRGWSKLRKWSGDFDLEVFEGSGQINGG